MDNRLVVSLVDDTPSPTCTSTMFSCFRSEKRGRSGHDRSVSRISMREGMADVKLRLTRRGVERELGAVHDQPSLIQPMKLTVYDAMPSTPAKILPVGSNVLKMVGGRRILSRPSSRNTLRKRQLSKTQPTVEQPIHRNPSFRPIQLSMHQNDSRLSCLPEFGTMNFTVEGSLQPPPKALIRAQFVSSSDLQSPVELEAGPVTMTNSTLTTCTHTDSDSAAPQISHSRSVSEHDALGSHSVKWYAMPGLPEPALIAPRALLSSVGEGFTPPPSGAVIIGNNILSFPDIEPRQVSYAKAELSLLPATSNEEYEPGTQSPTVGNAPERRTTLVMQHKPKLSQAATILLTSNSQSTRARSSTNTRMELQITQPDDIEKNNRISQWLSQDPLPTETKRTPATRSRASSYSTIKTMKSTSSTKSFAEHRRKRSEFYSLNPQQNRTAETTLASSAILKPFLDTAVTNTSPTNSSPKSPPTPLKIRNVFPKKIYNKVATAGEGNESMPVSRIAPALPSPHTVKLSESSSHYSVNTKGQPGHSRNVTASTIVSTTASDNVFDKPEQNTTMKDEVSAGLNAFQSARMHLAAHCANDDAGSVTTYSGFGSRTGTMKSSITVASSFHNGATRNRSPIERLSEHYDAEHEEADPDLILEVKSKPTHASTKLSGFVFRASTPDVRVDSPYPSPGFGTLGKSAAADVENLMYAMCADAGLRRVNVGVAF